MPAIRKWNIQYLKENFKNNNFPIEIYKDKMSMKKTSIEEIKKYPFDNFINNIENNDQIPIYCAEINLLSFKNKINDIIFEDINYNYDRFREPNKKLFFLGNKSYSGCHIHLTGDYILNQIFGKKTVYLFDYYDNYSLGLKFNSFWSRN